MQALTGLSGGLGAPAASSGGGLLSGVLGTAGKAWNSLGPYGKAVALNMGGSIMQNKAAENAQEDEIRRRNANLSGKYEPINYMPTTTEDYMEQMRRGYA